jgi:GT2 family glycosyltransferase
MKISIIIINYNGYHHLQNLFGSINKLNYPKNDLEVIFFDNGSTDGSVEIAKNYYPQVKIISNEINIGFAAPHRIAAQQAKGEILAFLNNDMRVDQNWIREGVTYLKPEKNVVCVSSKIFSWDGKNIDFNGGSLQYLGYADQYHKDEIKDNQYILFPCGGAMLIYKEVFLKAGCFDDDYFAIFEDVDLGWRLWLMGYKVVMGEKSFVYHKGHATLDSQNESKKRYLMHKNALVTIIKNYDEDNLKKILPIAVNLAVKRAMLFSNIDKRSFYFWENGDTDKILSSAKNNLEGFLHLAALDDVFDEYEHIMDKRCDVQAKRIVKDPEIFTLFKDPLRNIMGFKEYLWQENSLLDYFHLDELFKCHQHLNNNLDHGVHLARNDLNYLRREINKIIACGNQVEFPSRNIDNIWKKFIRRSQEKGLFSTLGYSMAYCINRIKRR